MTSTTEKDLLRENAKLNARVTSLIKQRDRWKKLYNYVTSPSQRKRVKYELSAEYDLFDRASRKKK